MAQAYVMDDGRRAFRTQDGTQVFDEFGGEVSAEELNPDLIDTSYPTWEAFSAEIDQRQELTQHRTEILEFQEKVDAVHEQIADGDISEADLDTLDADLLDAMPLAVRDHVASLEPPAAAPGLKTESTSSAAMPQIQNAVVSAVLPTPNL